MSEATLYAWKSKHAGASVAALNRLKRLEEENRKLKQMFADLSEAENAEDHALTIQHSLHMSGPFRARQRNLARFAQRRAQTAVIATAAA